MFSEFLSLCSQGWGSSAKKCLCPEGGGILSQKVLIPGGGVISQNALQVGYIMHCSLPVISLLTCYQKKVMKACICVISLLTCYQKKVVKACICLYSQAARHSGILPPPPLGHRNYGGAWCAIKIRIASLLKFLLEQKGGIAEPSYGCEIYSCGIRKAIGSSWMLSEGVKVLWLTKLLFEGTLRNRTCCGTLVQKGVAKRIRS